MSIEAVNQFLQKVNEDPQLQEELAQALDAENDREAATQLAAKHGYEFTPDELWTAIQNGQSEFQARQEAGQLSEEELEAVAGGLCTPVAVATPATTTYLAAGGVTAAGGIAAGVVSKAKW